MTRRARIGQAFALVLVLALAAALFAPVAGAKSYHFTSVDIKATVLSNGDIHIVEDRTARFVGSFSELWYEVSLSGSDGIADVSVYESGRRLTQSSSGTRGTFKVEQSGNKATIYVYYSASNEERTFTFDYKLRNAITVYNDTAELYWKFIGDAWDVRTDRVRVEVFFPSEVSQEELRVWAHGPLQGEVTRTDTPSMLVTVESLPPKTFVECRAAFPTSAVPAAARKVNKNALPGIVEEETKWADQANAIRDRVRQQLARGEYVDIEAIQRELDLSRQPRWRQWLVHNDVRIALAILVAALVVLIAIRIKYDREYPPEFEGDYYRELPGEYTPAVLGVLWRFGSPASEDLTAEIMNLARRGYLKIVEKKTEKKRAFGLLGTAVDLDYTIEKTEKLTSDAGELLQYERELIDFLFGIGSGQAVTFDEITAYAKRRPQAFLREFNEWKAGVSAYAEKFGFFDTEVVRGKVIGALLGLAFVGLGVLLFVLSSKYNAVVAGFSGFISSGILMVGSLTMQRRSHSGSTELRKWQAFRKFLTDFSSMDRATIPSLIVWEHYLVYAISLGVAKEVIRQLPIVFPELRDDPSRFGRTWLYMSSIDSTRSAFSRLDSLTTAMNQSVAQAQAIARSASSSGSGRGGGFSAGGGGGGGGTGGGAR